MFARILRALVYSLLCCLLLSSGSVLLMRWVNPITSTFMLRERIIAFATNDRNFNFQHVWVDSRSISPAMKLAVIASEDQKFPDHWGFDLDSIDKAWEQKQRGGRVRGASTISQQVAKNLYLWPGQSWLRKGVEVYFTVLIESLWPKRRILEVYLNSAEFGYGIYGVGAASQKYFGKQASRLSTQEAALLAAVLPNPKRLRVDRPSAYVRARQNWIVRQMWGLGGNSYLAEIK